MNKSRLQRLERSYRNANSPDRKEQPLFLFLDGDHVHTPRELVESLEIYHNLPRGTYEAGNDPKNVKLPVDSPLVEKLDRNTGQFYLHGLNGYIRAVDYAIDLSVKPD